MPHDRLELKNYQLFAHRAPYANLHSDIQVIRAKINRELPARPLNREPLGLNDGVWDKIQACWDSIPDARPTIGDMRNFLEQIHSGWVPPASEVINTLVLNSPDAHRTGTLDMYTQFTPSTCSVGSTDQESSGMDPSFGTDPSFETDSVSDTTIRDETTVLARKILDMYRNSLPGMTSREILP